MHDIAFDFMLPHEAPMPAYLTEVFNRLVGTVMMNVSYNLVIQKKLML